jgi:hypothetical protein
MTWTKVDGETEAIDKLGRILLYGHWRASISATSIR